MPLDAATMDAIAQFDAEIARLRDHGLPPFGSPGYIKAFMASADARTKAHAQEKEVWRLINRQILPVLLDAYVHGDTIERERIRDVVHQYPTISWGLGWAGEDRPPLSKQTPTAAQLRQSLVLLTMKDGVHDWRDEIVALDEMTKAAARSGIEIVAMFREAAALASNKARGGRKSMRDVLLERAERPLGRA